MMLVSKSLIQAEHSLMQPPKYVWWKHGVIYHIYVRSFCDSNSDGIGDLKGVISKLDYLQSLGINAIWLSPIYRSTNYDYGYDVAHYRKIAPEYGSMDDFKLLLQKCHSRNIKVIMDLVLNHTSNQHDWFLESSSSLNNPKRDWYIWKKGNGRRPPNNWKSAFGKSAWTLDVYTGEYYYHSFLPQQPDLNWQNKELRKELFEDIKFWLDLGVDGYRLDVINMLGKDKQFRNNPSWLGNLFIRGKYKYRSRNRSRSIKVSKKLRELLDDYDDKDRMAVGEIYTMPPGDPNLVSNYLGEKNDGLNMAFDFSLIFARWSAKGYYQSLQRWFDSIPPGSWPCNVLSNHDLLRNYNRNKWRSNKYEKAKLEAVLLLTIKGTPFIYYGEEIGQANNKQIKRKDLRDPLGKKYWPIFKGRDPARSPMQWTSEQYAGFSDTKPWLPINKDRIELANVAAQEKEQYSMLNLYKRLLKIRERTPALWAGDWTAVDKGENGILSYTRILNNNEVFVILNFSKQTNWYHLQPKHDYELIFSIVQPKLVKKQVGEKVRLRPYDSLIFIKKQSN